MPRSWSSARRSRSTADRPGRGAAADGSTSIKAIPQSAIERFKIALDLAPHDPLAFNSMVGIGCAHFKAGHYAEAARWQERALIEHPVRDLGASNPVPGLCAGRSRRRRPAAASARCGEHYPDLTVSEVQRGMPPLPQDYRNLVVGSLQEVGLPA